MKTYLNTNKENTFIKLEVKYSKGGTAMFTHKIEKRGYYLHVSPVIRENRENNIIIEMYTAFSGYKQLLNELKRDSPKAYNEAIILKQNYLSGILDILEKENNIIILRNENIQ